jgi:two-component system chemotaxis response regulator CheY
MDGDVADIPMKLPEILGGAAAEGLLATVRELTISGTPLCVDAAAVEVLTFPCVQIMLAAARSHGRIAVQNPSNEFVSAFADLGIDWTLHFERSDEQAQDASPEPIPEPAPQELPDVPAPPLMAEAEQSAAAEAENQPQEQSVEAAVEPSADVGAMQSEPEPVQPSESAMSTRILTIDDSKTMRDMLMLTLAEAGFDVLQAVDGQDGLDVLVKERVDVIITDINMPRMDGYEVIRQLRRNPEHKGTPILVLTTESETEKKNLAREIGATGWLVKPFDPDRLVETVRKVAP